ncbi:YwhD family protein [Cytobacillus horneckiae]|uniref:YwhD family protein n=1 Tax=Cytobacillus horneckiae TaxID=549687 RepID=UPI0008263002|nr:YwhD family protein [Cytobacillus horneckiae]MEC1156225.1 YwhD family protein [Cytobacillus horneckiae]MED2938243.1 YwhD family protein [Cytobacillus horneckiae]
MKSQSRKANVQFPILKNDPTIGDGGFGIGTLSLENITPVIVEPDNDVAYIDMDALHGKSKVEKKVRFQRHTEELIEPHLYWIVWVAINIGKSGAYYSGIAAAKILVSREERRIKLGYKSLPEHVNYLDKALKGKYIFNHMDRKSKAILKDFLEQYEDYWKNTTNDFKKLWEREEY